jgi:peptide/nickel transport system substrate-binding protein
VQNERATEAPFHYLKTFHQKHNPDIEAEVKKNNQTTWIDLFNFMFAEQNNAQKPVLWAWVLNQSFGEGTTQVTADRNPYYFKVDPEGNQLPYIDKYTHVLGTDNEVLVLKGLEWRTGLPGAVDQCAQEQASLL